MQLAALEKLRDNRHPFLEGKDIKQVRDHLVIQGLVPMPVRPSLSFDRRSDINLELNGTNFGRIKFVVDRGERDIHSFPDDEMICFLQEYDQAEIGDSRHVFRNDFVLINEVNFESYLDKFKRTSPVWGSFFHLEDLPSIQFLRKVTPGSIEIVDDLAIDNSVYLENLSLSIQEPNPMNRFLKLYHLLELQFDLHTAILIKNLLAVGRKEKEISSKLKSYTRNEEDRLESLLKERCSDLNRLVPFLNNIKPFEPKAIEIFYEYGREKNPLQRQAFNQIIGATGGFEKVFIQSIGQNFESLIPKVIAYWIYRVRCCVAHNKFGEYIMTSNDEAFIVEFAEPLLKEVVVQCFKKFS